MEANANPYSVPEQKIKTGKVLHAQVTSMKRNFIKNQKFLNSEISKYWVKKHGIKFQTGLWPNSPINCLPQPPFQKTVTWCHSNAMMKYLINLMNYATKSDLQISREWLDTKPSTKQLYKNVLSLWISFIERIIQQHFN